MEHLKQLSREQMQDRLDEITPVIDKLAEAYRSGINVAVITVVYNSAHPKSVTLPFLGEMKVPTGVKQFIHDFFTLLCAEKLLLETYLEHGIQ